MPRSVRSDNSLIRLELIIRRLNGVNNGMKNKSKALIVLLLAFLWLFIVVKSIRALHSIHQPSPSTNALFISILAVLTAVVLFSLFENFSQNQPNASRSASLNSLIANGAAQMVNAAMICRPNEEIIWVNQAFTSMTGFAFEETIGSIPGELLQGVETNPATVAEIRSSLREGRPYVGDILNYKKDGTPIWIHLEVKQIRDSHGQVEALFSSQTDITERQKYESKRDRQLSDALAAADLDPLTGLHNHRTFHNHLRAQSLLALQNGSRLAVLMIDLENFKFFNEAYGHLVGDHVLKQVADTLMSASIGFGFEDIARFGGDEFAVLIPELDKLENDVAPGDIVNLFNHLGYRPPGYDRPIPITVAVGMAVFPDDGRQVSDVLAAADNRLTLAKTGLQHSPISAELKRSINQNDDGFSMLDALVTAVDNKDRYTRRHSEDVLDYALNIAETLGLDDESKKVLAVAALLHDVGKIGVPDRILRKPGALTEEEFQAVKQHPQMGAVIVGAVSGFESTLDAIMYHHERWDGKGYPTGLRADKIPQLARIMAVADGYSAMTTNRPYRQGMTRKEAFSILQNGAGSQWDPEIVDAMLRCFYAKAA
jgi:diguanylate cyclase (GGDEF)-like protein/PAS domain S-box-containing protein